MNRFRITEAGYKYDKFISFSVLFIVLGVVFYILYLNSFDFKLMPYFNCSKPMCENPFYLMRDCTQTLTVLWFIPIYKTEDCRDDCDWCKEQFLMKGTYGKKPKGIFFLDNGYVLAFGLIFVGLIVNHLVHNIGKKFDIEIPISKKLIINRRTIMEYFKENEKRKDNQ